MKDDFDPLSDLFVAQFAKPPGLASVNLRALTPFQRALLVIDGTVTKFIEAYTMEPVTVQLISQEWRRLGDPHVWLEADEGTTVIAREVALEGVYSNTVYAHAVSLVVPDRLPPEALRQLDANPGGLGRILVESRLETRREVLWYGRERLDELPEAIRGRMGGEVVSRTYRILTGGRAVMLIHERFPLEADADRFPSQI